MERETDAVVPETVWRVVSHYGIEVLLRSPKGIERRAPVDRQASLVVGDEVVWPSTGLQRRPRTRALQRRDRRGRIRTVASNLTAMGVVVAPRPRTPDAFIDRAIVGARAVDIEPFFVVNKSDLGEGNALVDHLLSHWPGVEPVLSVSATTGQGLDALQGWLAGGARAVFVGVSGVGKSSLMNALVEDLALTVGEINPQTELGRHVTTNATLHRLAEGGELIDTPGFRDFGPVAISAGDLAAYFPGFEAALSERCRYRDCRHRTEPQCAVLQAVTEGRIGSERHAAYMALQDELTQVDRARRR
ncbi:MAG: ribosome small subunit-dependent GTPase A [bacterium TMED88]|nr:ribosome small subunit-dependent GTPase A [Deltaproteobacteria bacterium]OUV36263.1 MAG: ribosome small subunit-dependent GTPase A [bacterium TMED88]